MLFVFFFRLGPCLHASVSDTQRAQVIMSQLSLLLCTRSVRLYCLQDELLSVEAV